jgi:hypothetical protein
VVISSIEEMVFLMVVLTLMEEVMLLMSYGSAEVEKFMLNNCGDYCLLPLEVVEGHL